MPYIVHYIKKRESFLSAIYRALSRVQKAIILSLYVVQYIQWKKARMELARPVSQEQLTLCSHCPLRLHQCTGGLQQTRKTLRRLCQERLLSCIRSVGRKDLAPLSLSLYYCATVLVWVEGVFVSFIAFLVLLALFVSFVRSEKFSLSILSHM